MTNQKVEVARERYFALLAAAQEELAALNEQRSSLTLRMSEVKGRLEDIQLALDVFTSAEQEESAPGPPAPEPAAPALRKLDVVDALLVLAYQRRRREVDAATATAWLKLAGYRNRQNKVPTGNAVSNALAREHNLEAGHVTRVARGVYRLNW